MSGLDAIVFGRSVQTECPVKCAYSSHRYAATRPDRPHGRADPCLGVAAARRAACAPRESRSTIDAADVDESLHEGESPEAFVRRLAEAKAQAAAVHHPGRAVLGADTVVVAGDEILGKPASAGDARRMLALLSGRTHLVLTGVCMIVPEVILPDERAAFGWPEDPAGTGPRVEVARTMVEFGVLEPAVIDWYVASGEPMDKAGAYAIQGLASRFVTRIDGSYSNVVGLPVALVSQMCKAAGILLF